MTKGWKREPARHSLASRGFKTQMPIAGHFHYERTYPIQSMVSSKFKLSQAVNKQLVKLAKHYNEYGGVISSDGAKILNYSEGSQMCAPNLTKCKGDIAFHTHPKGAMESTTMDAGWSMLDVANFYRLPFEKFVLAEGNEIFILEKNGAKPTEDEIWKAWFTGVRKQYTFGQAEFVPLAMTYIGPNEDCAELNKILSKNVIDEFQNRFGMKSYSYKVN